MYPLEKQERLTHEQLHKKAEEFAEMLHTPAQSKQDVIDSYIAGYSHGHYHAIVERKTDDEPVVPKKEGWRAETMHYQAASYMHGNQDINQFMQSVRDIVHFEDESKALMEEAEKQVQHYNATHKEPEQQTTQLSLF